MTSQQLKNFEMEGTRALIQNTMATLVQLDADPTAIANESITVANLLKDLVKECLKTLAPSTLSPVSLADRLLSPLRNSASSSTVTEPKVPCVESCKITIKAKTITCSLWSEEFHMVCVGLTSSRKVWFCPNCKNITKTLRDMKSTMTANECKCAQLEAENLSLKRELSEYKQQMRALEEKLNARPSPGPQTSSQESISTPRNNSKTLLIGDSIIKDINEKGLSSDVKVECKRGGETKDIKEIIEKSPIEEFNTLIIQVGTNDCTSDDDIANAEQDFDAMLSNVTQRQDSVNCHPECWWS